MEEHPKDQPINNPSGLATRFDGKAPIRGVNGPLASGLHLAGDVGGSKKCRKCGQIKLITEFYKTKKGGEARHPDCKKCDHSKYNEYLKNNPERRKAYRAKQPVRENHHTNENKAKVTASRMKYLGKKPGINLAWKKVNSAINAGKIIKPAACESCGMKRRIIHAHHPDYKQPLLVMWLCPKCHKAAHNRQPLTSTA